MENVKTCRECGETKLLSKFYKNKNTKDGYLNQCNDCRKLKHPHSCYNKEYNRKYQRIYADKNRLNRIYTAAKNRCKDKLREFSISLEYMFELWENQKGRCAYTNLPLLATANQFNTVSLDRIDSSKGYVVGNVQLVCAAVNKMKQEYSEDLFILLSLLVTQNSKLSESPESLLARYFPLGTSDSNAPDNISLCSDVERI